MTNSSNPTNRVRNATALDFLQPKHWLAWRLSAPLQQATFPMVQASDSSSNLSDLDLGQTFIRAADDQHFKSIASGQLGRQ
jgi:hypothetical protein